MNKTLTDRRASLIIVLMCFIAYTIIGLTRNAYTAALAGIISDGIFTKTAAGTINSSFYITYSLAQILGSFYVDKISPFKVITIGLIGTMLANVAMSVSASFAVIFIARAFIGIAQFGVWPALLKIVSEYICQDYRRKSMYLMPLGMQVGTIISYLVASIVLAQGSWQDLFVVSYVILGIITVIFVVTVYFIDKKAVVSVPKSAPAQKSDAPVSDISTWKIILSSGAILIFISSFAKSMVSSGIASWMPTMIMESYDMSASFSSVLTTLTSCSNLVSVFWVILLYPRVFKSETVATGMFFLMSLPLIIVMSFVGKIPLIVTIIMVVFVNMFKNSIHQFYTVEIPAGYKKYNKAGMMAGLINAATCIGSMIAGTIYGWTADTYGWSTTILVWAALCFVGMAACFIASPIWKKFTKGNN